MSCGVLLFDPPQAPSTSATNDSASGRFMVRLRFVQATLVATGSQWGAKIDRRGANFDRMALIRSSRQDGFMRTHLGLILAPIFAFGLAGCGDDTTSGGA